MYLKSIISPISRDNESSVSLDTIDETETMEPAHPRDATSEHEHVYINLILLDWDNTLMPSSYITSAMDYDIDEKSQKIKSLFIKNDGIEELTANLEKAGNASYELLQKICTRYEPSNIKIVTNGAQKWFKDSLILTSYFSKIWQKIAALLTAQNIEIVFARNNNLNYIHWKTKCFDRILWQYLNVTKVPKLNITTVGDQWHDHHSIQQTFSWQMYAENISHHQIKLFAEPDCRYLCIEHKYICDLMDDDVLFEFIDNNQQGICLEFEGYHEEA